MYSKNVTLCNDFVTTKLVNCEYGKLLSFLLISLHEKEDKRKDNAEMTHSSEPQLAHPTGVSYSCGMKW